MTATDKTKLDFLPLAPTFTFYFGEDGPLNMNLYGYNVTDNLTYNKIPSVFINFREKMQSYSKSIRYLQLGSLLKETVLINLIFSSATFPAKLQRIEISFSTSDRDLRAPLDLYNQYLDLYIFEPGGSRPNEITL